MTAATAVGQVGSTATPVVRRSPSRMPAAARARVTVAVGDVVGFVAAVWWAWEFDVVQWPVASGYVAAVAVVFAAGRQYRARLNLRAGDQIPRVVFGALAPLVAFLLAGLASPGLAVLALLLAGVVVAGRVASYGWLRQACRRGRLGWPTLVVGTSPEAVEITRLLADHPELGSPPAGYLASPGQVSEAPEALEALEAPEAPEALEPRAPRQAVRPLPRPAPVLGGFGELAKVVAEHRLSRVVVADSGEDLVGVLRGCRPLPAEVYVCPGLAELGLAVPRWSVDDVRGMPVLRLRSGGGVTGRTVKRLFDACCAGVLLVLTAPLVAALAVAVRTCCGRPSLVRQVRLSRDREPVQVVKLRTVPIGEQAANRWAVSPRECSRLCRFLRTSHLDELPQLVNVVRGEMSLVGPRPERPYFADRFSGVVPRYDDRRRVPGGLTGWAQVNGLVGDTSITERVRFDNYYIDYWSLWFDLVVVARTFTVVLNAVLAVPLAAVSTVGRRLGRDSVRVGDRDAADEGGERL